MTNMFIIIIIVDILEDNMCEFIYINQELGISLVYCLLENNFFKKK
jgi:hypothetical protein